MNIFCWTPSATLIDGMALVQKVEGEHKTFGQVASSILASAVREGHHSSRIDIVFDVYKDHSIKAAERHNQTPEWQTLQIFTKLLPVDN